MKQVLLLFTLTISLQTFAQNVTASYLNVKKVQNGNLSKIGNYFFDDFRELGGGMHIAFASVKKVRYGLTIIKFDSNLQKVKELSVDKGKKSFGPFKPTAFYSDNAVYALYYENTGNDVSLSASKIDPETLTISATKKLFDFPGAASGAIGAGDPNAGNSIRVTHSPDNRLLFIVHSNRSAISSCIVDEDLNMVSVPEGLPLPPGNLTVSSIFVTNSAKKLIAYADENDKHGIILQDLNSKPNFNYFPVNTADRRPSNLRLESSSDKSKIFITGNYHETQKQDSKGIFYTWMDTATLSIATPQYFPFSESIKERIFALDFGSRIKGNIYLQDIDFRLTELAGGKLVFSGMSFTTSSFSNGAEKVYAGPITLLFVSNDGKSNFSLIPRRQVYNFGSDYMIVPYNENLVCIYNDIAKSFEKEPPDNAVPMVNAGKDLIPIAVTFDGMGNVIAKKKVVEQVRDDSMLFLIWRHKIDDHQFLIPYGMETSGLGSGSVIAAGALKVNIF